MSRIKIKDLPKNRKISQREMQEVMGGGVFGKVGNWIDDRIESAANKGSVVANKPGSWLSNAFTGDDGSSSSSSSGGGSKPNLTTYETSGTDY